MKIIYEEHSINLDDPKYIKIREAKDRADNVIEWGAMFHTGSLVMAIVGLVVAIFGSLAQWLAIFLLWIVLFVISQILRAHARAIIVKAIREGMQDDQ